MKSFLQSKKYLNLSGLSLCLLITTSVCHAQDTDRITQLEREISELKNRITRLESATVGSKSNTRTVPNGDGWKSIANWRSLKKGMSFDDVRAILGEPVRIQGGTLTYWTYPDRGSVTFYNDRLDGWTEPR